MQSAVFSIVFPKFEYKFHPNHLYALTAYVNFISIHVFHKIMAVAENAPHPQGVT